VSSRSQETKRLKQKAWRVGASDQCQCVGPEGFKGIYIYIYIYPIQWLELNVERGHVPLLMDVRFIAILRSTTSTSIIIIRGAYTIFVNSL
jgi:hypothetical protein